jgi:hypothetical protein
MYKARRPTSWPRPSQSCITSFVSIASCIADLDLSTAPMSPARAPPTIRSDCARGKQAMHSAAAAAPDTLSHASSSPISTPFASFLQSLDTDPIPCITSAQSDLASASVVAGITSRTCDTIRMSTCSGRSIGACATVAKQARDGACVTVAKQARDDGIFSCVASNPLPDLISGVFVYVAAADHRWTIDGHIALLRADGSSGLPAIRFPNGFVVGSTSTVVWGDLTSTKEA